MAFIYGSPSDCTYKYYECQLGYQVNSQDIANNKSNITLRLEVRSKASSGTRTYGYNQTTIIDGTSLGAKTMPDMRNSTAWKLFGEMNLTITHNPDGTFSSNKEASFTTKATTDYSLKSGSASVTVTLPTIPRATTPTVSSSSVAMGSSVTISTPRASSSFTHTLTYSFGSTSGTIASNVGTSQSWTPPLSLANQVPRATSGTCTITCKTYNGSTLIGTKTVSLTLTVPSSVVPSISSVALSEGNSTMSSKKWGVYVQNKSQLKVVTSASGSYGSAIKSYKITGIDSNTYSSNNFTSNTLTGTGSKTITVKVTDSRGRTATKTATYNCVAYSNPTISSASAVRCDSDGTTNEEGTYIKYTFKANVSEVSNKNSHTFKIGYKTTSSSSYTYVTISNDGYSLSKSNVVLSGVTFSPDNAYNIIFSVQDAFTTTTKTISISTAFALMNWNASGKSMAIGKVSEAGSNEKKLELGLETYRMSGETSDVVGYRVVRTDTEKEIRLCIGSAGVNRGIYDGSKWLLYENNNGVYCKGTADNATKWNELTDDHATINTTSTDVLVLSGSNVQKRTIPAGTPVVPKVLYSNGSGTSGTVSLSASTEGWKNIRISYKNGDNQHGSTVFTANDAYSVNGKTTYGTIVRKDSDNNTLMINSALFNLSGTTITITRNSQGNIYMGGSSASDSNELKITRVEVWN